MDSDMWLYKDDISEHFIEVLENYDEKRVRLFLLQIVWITRLNKQQGKVSCWN